MVCDSHLLSRGFLSSIYKLGFSSSLPLHMEQHYMPIQGAGNARTFVSHSVLLSKMKKNTYGLVCALKEVRANPSFLNHDRAFSCSYPNCKLYPNPRSSYLMQCFRITKMVANLHMVRKAASWRVLMSHGTHFLHSSTETSSRQSKEEWSSLVVRPEKRLMRRSLTVAVDIDEVLGSFLLALNTFIAEQYLCQHNISEFHVYDFTKVWQCSRAEADLRVHSFFKSTHFDKGIVPIPGAYKALCQIASFCNLCVVTSRQNVIKEETLAWIERHYSGIFSEVHFGNHFALEGEARRKSDICKCVGAQVLIDDNPVYALDCAKNGMEVLLFDFNNSYPWSKTPGPQHPLITRVHNWEDVERILRQKLSIVET